MNALAVFAVIVVAAGTTENPDSEADSPSPTGIGSVIPGIPGMPDGDGDAVGAAPRVFLVV
ncbi:MAG TPA: hypothetical protein VLZ05_12465 [Mycobacterium sp.]|nr:hypothetical protein [Mycobacterium sp.]